MKADIEVRMSDLKQRLGIGAGTAASLKPRKAGPKRRRLSAAGRANIVAALMKRWAARRKEQSHVQAQAAAKAATRRKAKPAPKPKVLAKAAPKKSIVKAKRPPARKAAISKANLLLRIVKPQPAPAIALEQTAPPAEAQ
jgi:hypothetical protein